jgi:hypothetical protein
MPLFCPIVIALHGARSLDWIQAPVHIHSNGAISVAFIQIMTKKSFPNFVDTMKRYSFLLAATMCSKQIKFSYTSFLSENKRWLLQKANQDENCYSKEAFNTKMSLLTSKLNIELKQKLVRCYVWRIALYGSETWTLRKLERKYLESFEM